MSTLADPKVREAVLIRLRALRPDSPRQWGKMNPHQMVCHLTDAFRMAGGERPGSAIDTFLSRTVIRWVALHTPLAWPRGVQTRPEADQVAGGGTPPAEWARDAGELARRIENFHTVKAFAPHPIFGLLTPTEWGVWGFRHVDHHFRQFGA